jgi:signal transduction histidine kinase
VTADPDQLDQVLLNLAANARDAMPGGGALTVSTPSDSGEWAWVTVSDTGAGMPAAVRGRLFEPNSTTKPAGKGTSLGLGIIADIVAPHGGKVEVDSEPGRGTTFRIGLPAVAHPAETTAARDLAVAAP